MYIYVYIYRYIVYIYVQAMFAYDVEVACISAATYLSLFVSPCYKLNY